LPDLSDRTKWEVPFLDLQLCYQELKEELDAAYHRVMSSGRYVLGPEVETFEAEFAAYCGARHCVAVGNGLEALRLILQAYGIGPGDEVIVPANTFIATWLAVSHAGANPVPVEPSSTTYNIDPDRLSEAITDRTRAIIAVHLYGQPAAMDAICDVARQYGVRVIEDAAQAHGARFRGRLVGAQSDASGFSFYPTKNLGAFGDAGAVMSNDEHLMKRVRLLRNYGSKVKHYNETRGFNSRLDPLQAAFLRVRLKHLDEWNLRRQAVAEMYRKDLAGATGCVLPFVPDWVEPAWHLFVIRHPSRDLLREHLLSLGIETGIHYPVPPHLSEAYSDKGWDEGVLPITEELATTVLSLPMSPHLQPAQIQRVSQAILQFEPE
jgi:dTDP-4-amino-4,6-dideoxygalactose transaminase